MSNTLKIILGALIVLGIAGFLALSGKETLVGAVDCQSTTCFTSLGVTPGTLTTDGGIINTGTFSSTATSTLTDVVMSSAGTTTLKILSTSSTQGGCVEMNATSTATRVRLMFSTVATTTYSGFVTWSYGTCE